MSYPFITGLATASPAEPARLPLPDRIRQEDPAGYLLDADLVAAINAALLLAQPLLLTGDPGTGKTQLAHRIAWELGYGQALTFNTKSSSSARDLFYHFDSLGRFHAAHTGQGSANNLDYLVFNALGQALLESRSADAAAPFLRPGAVHGGPRRHVVLIDEIDKAPKDFPNDLLHEVDQLSVRIPELGNQELRADFNFRPVIVLTSNSERNLPDAFLRRCVFHHIPFPEKARLMAIVKSRLGAFFAGDQVPLLDSALEFFKALRGKNLRKPPATAELINWLQLLVEQGARPSRPLHEATQALQRSKSVLAKSRDDAELLDAFIAEHMREHTPPAGR